MLVTTLLALGLLDGGSDGYTTPASRAFTVPSSGASVTLPKRYAEEVLDYKLNWTPVLAGDIVASATVTVVSGSIVATRMQEDASSSSFWLSGGKSGSWSLVKCAVITSGGREIEALITIQTL